MQMSEIQTLNVDCLAHKKLLETEINLCTFLIRERESLIIGSAMGCRLDTVEN